MESNRSNGMLWAMGLIGGTLRWLARMLVSILTPLFPGAVREKWRPQFTLKSLLRKQPLRHQRMWNLKCKSQIFMVLGFKKSFNAWELFVLRRNHLPPWPSCHMPRIKFARGPMSYMKDLKEIRIGFEMVGVLLGTSMVPAGCIASYSLFVAIAPLA